MVGEVVATAVAAAATKHSHWGLYASMLNKGASGLLFLCLVVTQIVKTLAMRPIPGAIMPQREWPDSGLR